MCLKVIIHLLTPSNLLIFFDVFKYTLRTYMNIIPITTTGIRKYGLTAAATTIEPTMLRITWVASSIAFGKNSSVALQMLVINHISPLIFNFMSNLHGHL